VEYYDCPVGLEQGKNVSNGEEIVSASMQSMKNRLHKFKPDDFHTVIIDECFPEGTLVGNKPIQNIKIGDFVDSYNHVTNKIEKKKVTYLFKKEVENNLVLINNTLKCTKNHPIYIKDKGYIPAFKVEKGDYYYEKRVSKTRQKEAGFLREIRVENITFQKQRNSDKLGKCFVYNIEVDKNNNYFANDILVHNCHHSAAKTFQKVIEYFKPYQRIGFTATPNRCDGLKLDHLFTKIIFEKDLKWGIDNGFLSRIQCYKANIGYDLSNIRKRMGDLVTKELEKEMGMCGANDAIIELYHKYPKPAVIFCVNVDHAEELSSRIDNSLAITGKTKKRLDKLEKFKQGSIDCLTTVQVLTEGVNLPNIKTVIMARPTLSSTVYIQAVGRGTRLYENKEFLTLIDCVGNSGKFNLCGNHTLLGLDIEDIPDNQEIDLIGDLLDDLPGLIEQKSDNPKTWIKNIEKIDLFSKKNNYNLFDVNYFKHPDGSMIVSLANNEWIGISTINQLGKSTIISSGKKKYALNDTQENFNEIFKLLKKHRLKQRPLWSTSSIKRWGKALAEQKQKGYAFGLLKKHGYTYNLKGISKKDCSCIINRLKEKK